jgi:hypothetical protein
MCLETHVVDETKTTTMKFLLEQCLSYIYQVQFSDIAQQQMEQNSRIMLGGSDVF